MRRFADIEEILETNEVEIISNKDPVLPKKKKQQLITQLQRKPKFQQIKYQHQNVPRKLLLLLQRKLVLPQCAVHMEPATVKY